MNVNHVGQVETGALDELRQEPGAADVQGRPGLDVTDGCAATDLNWQPDRRPQALAALRPQLSPAVHVVALPAGERVSRLGTRQVRTHRFGLPEVQQNVANTGIASRRPIMVTEPEPIVKALPGTFSRKRDLRRGPNASLAD
jgi:hypothetical protein